MMYLLDDGTPISIADGRWDCVRGLICDFLRFFLRPLAEQSETPRHPENQSQQVMSSFLSNRAQKALLEHENFSLG